LCCTSLLYTRVSYMLICDCCIYPLFLAYFSKVRIFHIFPHKLALSTAILLLFVFLLPISIRFRYLDHLVANRMAPSMCPDPCGTRWGSWFQAILCHISAYFHRIFGVYAVRIFFKCRIKLTCLTRQNRQIFVEDVSWHASREAHAVTLEKKWYRHTD